MHLKGSGGTQTHPAAVLRMGCCATMETVPCFVLAQRFGPAACWGRSSAWSGGLCVALEQPLVATPAAAVLPLGEASAPAGTQGPWRGRPCRVALLLLKDCCFFSRSTDKVKTDTQFKRGPPKALHFGPSNAW